MLIRRLPADFVVEETLWPAAAGAISELPGPKRSFAAYRVTKQSLTTTEAARRLAKAVGVKPGDVSYAGLKDKHALTMQTMTVGSLRDPMRVARQVGSMETEGFVASLVGWTSQPAAAAWIETNRFIIVIRGLSASDADTIARTLEGFRHPDEHDQLRLLNEFGEQRFGSARHGQGFAGPSLIAGDFETALRLLIGTPARKDAGARRSLTRVLAAKWGRWNEVLLEAPKCPERRAIEVLASGGDFRGAFQALPELTKTMAVESYQSWLWNRIAQRVAAGASSDRFAALHDLTIPTVGPGVVLVEPWGAAASQVLAEERLDPQTMRIPGLRRPSFGVVHRPLFMRVSNVVLSAPFPDDLAPERSSKPLAIRLSFALPRGSYATVLLRALGC
jgi:tRNA pseudouridine13 synthase